MADLFYCPYCDAYFAGEGFAFCPICSAELLEREPIALWFLGGKWQPLVYVLRAKGERRSNVIEFHCPIDEEALIVAMTADLPEDVPWAERVRVAEARSKDAAIGLIHSVAEGEEETWQAR